MFRSEAPFFADFHQSDDDGGGIRNCNRENESISEATVLMQRLSYPTETVLFTKITRKRIVLSFEDSPRKPLGR